MKVFVTGATGWVGSAVVQQLLAAGHQVLGLVRSEANAQVLTAAGGTPLRGSLDDLASLRRGAEQADGIIHTAFGLDLADIAKSSREEQQAIEALGEVFAGSSRPIVATSGLGFAPAGQVLAEDNPAAPEIPGFPRAPSWPCGPLPSGACELRWCGCRAQYTVQASSMASCRCLFGWPAKKAYRPTWATARTCGPPCTGSTRPAYSAWPSNTERRAAPSTP